VFVLIILLTFNAVPAFAEPAELELHSHAAILMDPRTWNVLFEQNAREQLPPASLTKIMTAILAIELGDLDEFVVVSENAMDYGLSPLAARLGLLDGEEMRLRDLVSAIMLTSGNDAANVIAEHIGGDIHTFVTMMNLRAIQLGAFDTFFMNPTGLHHDEHLSTAYDMAMISRFAMTIPEFRQIVAVAHLYLDGTDLHPEPRYIINTNSMISRMRTPEYYFAPTIGVKTGFTSQAGLCLAAAAGRNRPFELISVTLGAPHGGTAQYAFVDTTALFNFGYANFLEYRVAPRGQTLEEVRLRHGRNSRHLILEAGTPLTILFPRDSEVSNIVPNPILPNYVIAPIEQGDVIGEIEFIYDGVVIGRTDLVASVDAPMRAFGFVFLALDWIWSLLLVRIIVYAVMVVAGLFVLLFLIGLVNAIRRSKRRSRRR